MIAISKYNKQHPLRVFEAFAGYGSQSLAFKYLKDKHPEFDFKVVGYSEIEPSAIQAYGLLHGRDIPNFGDVTRIDWNEVPNFDFISWSSPCQDFSNAGLRQGAEEGSGTRSSLIFQEKRMLAIKKPKYVMLENVKGLLSKSMRKYFFQYVKDLDSFGYTSFYKVLNAKDYGIPQNRERIFVISILRTEDEPNPEYHFPSHNVTLDNLVYCKRLRIIEILYKLTFHLLREDGFGWLWNVDGSLDFATITQSH
jgi:DNA-cytosine methyltransferase